MTLFLELIFARERERMRQFYPIYKSWVLIFPFVHLAGPDDVEVGRSKFISRPFSVNIVCKSVPLQRLPDN